MPTRSFAPFLGCTLLLACATTPSEESGNEGPPLGSSTGTSGGATGTASSGSSEGTGSTSGSSSGNTDPGGTSTSEGDTYASTTGSAPDLPTTGECDPLAQDCPAGEKCTFYVDEAHPDGTNACVPVTGEAQPGDLCTTLPDHSDTCVDGSLCWGLDGICHEICDEELACVSGGPCTVMADGALPLCLFPCDPVAQSCPTGWGCYDDGVRPDGWFCHSDGSGGAGEYGEPCDGFDQCDPGLVCVAAEQVASEACFASGATQCCAALCYLPLPNDCPDVAETCVSIYPGPPPAEFDHVGVCAL